MKRTEVIVDAMFRCMDPVAIRDLENATGPDASSSPMHRDLEDGDLLHRRRKSCSHVGEAAIGEAEAIELAAYPRPTVPKERSPTRRDNAGS